MMNDKFHLYSSDGGEKYLTRLTRLNVTFILGNALLLAFELISPCKLNTLMSILLTKSEFNVCIMIKTLLYSFWLLACLLFVLLLVFILYQLLHAPLLLHTHDQRFKFVARW